MSWISGTAGAVVSSAGEREASFDTKNSTGSRRVLRLISAVLIPCEEPLLSSSETSGDPVRGKTLVFGGEVSTIFNSAECTGYTRLWSRSAPGRLTRHYELRSRRCGQARLISVVVPLRGEHDVFFLAEARASRMSTQEKLVSVNDDVKRNCDTPSPPSRQSWKQWKRCREGSPGPLECVADMSTQSAGPFWRSAGVMSMQIAETTW